MKKVFKKLTKFLTQLRASIAKKGQYRFFLKSLDHMGDPNLAYNVISTEYFRDVLQPIELPYSQFRKVMVIAPHQDDEAIGAGGLLNLLASQKVEIDIVFISDGDQPGVENIVDIRRREAKKALGMIGASMHEISINDIKNEVEKSHVERLTQLINLQKPDLILSPWVLDAPAKHRFANLLLYLAIENGGSYAKEIWGYQVHNSILGNGYVDISKVIDKKISMIRSYDSQLKKDRPYDHIAHGLAAWNSRLIPRSGAVSNEYYELYSTLPVKEFQNLVKKFYLSNLNETFKHNQNLVQRSKELLKSY